MKLLVAGTAIAGALMLGSAAAKPPTSIFVKEPTLHDALALAPEAARNEGRLCGHALQRSPPRRGSPIAGSSSKASLGSPLARCCWVSRPTIV